MLNKPISLIILITLMFLESCNVNSKCYKLIANCEAYEEKVVFNKLNIIYPEYLIFHDYGDKVSMSCSKGIVEIKFRKEKLQDIELLNKYSKFSVKANVSQILITDTIVVNETAKYSIVRVEGRWHEKSKVNEIWTRVYFELDSEVYQFFIRYPKEFKEDMDAIENKILAYLGVV